MVTVPSSKATRVVERSSTRTQPEVPRIPVTMVEVRMFMLSPDFSATGTLKNREPAVAFSSSCLPDWATLAALEASSLAVLLLSNARHMP